MIVEILVCIVLLFGGFAGGVVVGMNGKPTSVTNIQNVTQTQEQATTTMQGQITIVVNEKGEARTNININMRGYTNMTIDFTSTTNTNLLLPYWQGSNL